MTLSVIIATMNRPDDLRAALESIAKQSLMPSEVLVIDQSVDNRTRLLVEGLKARDPRLTDPLLYYFQEEKSLVKARNRGISEASGELITFLDDDVVLFEDYFDKRKGKIGDLLSPFEDDSPIKKLKDEIFKKMRDLRDELLKEKSKEEIIEKTALKGGQFEETVVELVQDFCSEYEDKVTFVGENLGKTSKIGDINVDMGGQENRRIVIECKDSSAYSHKKTIDEINDAIVNRNAKFGIFLFKSQSQIPSALAPMKITNNYIVTSFDNYGLYFAIRVARMFVERSMEDRQNVIPIDKIQKGVEELRSKLFTFNGIQTKLTQINNASSYIQENIDRLKKDIEEGLDSIKRLLDSKTS